MQSKVVVTGVGVCSAIGDDVKSNLESLKKGKDGLSFPTILETQYGKSFPVGEIKLTNEELAKSLKLNNKGIYPRTALLALQAAREAFFMAGLNSEENLRVGIVGATTVGGMDLTERHYLNASDNPEFLHSHSGGYITELVARELKIRSHISTINTACSSSTNAIIYGAELVKNNLVDVVLAGGFDSLTKFTINGFKSLMLLSQEKCKPFDLNRTGLNLGEGAGFLVLESEKSQKQRNKPCLAIYSGGANSNDAFHQTASSPDGEGAYRSMTDALTKASLEPNDINYINTHGTGTDNNDLTEGIAIKRLFNSEVPDFSSTKSYIGHTLGAAGGIEAVYSILALRENCIFPNLNFNTPIAEHNLIPQTKINALKEINHIMSNSFGFGGNDSTVILSKYGE